MVSEPKKDDFKAFAINLASGGTAAAISKTVVAPIERVKFLLQVQVFYNILFNAYSIISIKFCIQGYL